MLHFTSDFNNTPQCAEKDMSHVAQPPRTGFIDIFSSHIHTLALLVFARGFARDMLLKML